MADPHPETADSRLAVPAGDGPLLKRLRIPEGWSATILSEFPDAEPSFIRATPEGNLFVSLAGTGAESRTGQGRILKLTGGNRGGKPIEIHEFVPLLNSPRGLEWDGEWLYLMNPPRLMAVRDTDGDHLADENRVLVEGISSGNGVTLGIDGWLYLAIGGRGIFDARGSNGARLQLRGGGVVRVRPDGTGLHLFSRGAGEIAKVAVSPTLDVFARGTPDPASGWEARLHHFTGLDHHGYPERFRNFGEDILPPIARYEGTDRGAGALYLAEPDLPGELNGILLTADPGQNRIVRHSVETTGAAFRENAARDFAGAPHPVDIDVDVARRLFVAGHSRENGKVSGYIAMLEPPDLAENFVAPQPAPIDAGTPTPSLIRHFLEGTTIRFAAQRAVLRNDLAAGDLDALEKLAADPNALLESRIAALFTMKLAFGEQANARVAGLATDPDLLPFVLRAFGDFPEQRLNLQPALFSKGLSSKDPRAQREAVLAISRLGLDCFVAPLAKLAVSEDPVISHLSINALAELRQIDDTFAILDDFDNYKIWPGLFRALAQIHEMKVVDGLISRLEKTDSSLFRFGALETLARLYHREGVWDESKPETSHVTDTRGPCFDPVTWEGSASIDAVFRKALRDKRINKTFLFREISRNRIPFDDFKMLLSIAAVTPELEDPAVTLILEQEEPPADALPFLTFVATSEDRPGDLRLRAAIALARARDDMAVTSAFRLSLERDEIEGIPGLRDELKATLLENGFHEKRYDWLLEEAHGTADDAGVLAWTILLQLTRMANLQPVAGNEIDAAIERAIARTAMLRRLLLAIADCEFSPDENLVIDALDHPDESVSEAARNAAIALKLDSDSKPAGDSR